MVSPLSVLPKRPEARTLSVSLLVDQVLRGRVRIPPFQRGLKWDQDDVRQLFDSIYRGYPIGSLLFWKHAEPAARVQLGPLLIDAAETQEAWSVVDGQQRLVALTATLARPAPYPKVAEPDDPYVIYFDAEARRFVSPPRNGTLPTSWVPLARMLDSADLSEFVYSWRHGSDDALRRALFEAGKLIRDYEVPLYVIETDDLSTLEEIFHRVNKSGRPLAWEDVYDAFFGHPAAQPSTLEHLQRDLRELAMGALEKSTLLGCVLGASGLDPTRSLEAHLESSRQTLEGSVQRALSPLRATLAFLRRDAGIPHRRVLPNTWPLAVLARFFALHGDPAKRSRELLARWLWRGYLGAGLDERTLQRRGVDAIDHDEEESVQRLLKLLPASSSYAVALPEAFDARAAASRIVMAAIASRSPRRLDTGAPIDVGALLEAEDRAAFARLLGSPPKPWARHVANRTIHPANGAVKPMLLACLDATDGDARLASHAIPRVAVQALAAGRIGEFFDLRQQALQRSVDDFIRARVAIDRGDRPTIEHLLREAP